MQCQSINDFSAYMLFSVSTYNKAEKTPKSVKIGAMKSNPEY